MSVAAASRGTRALTMLGRCVRAPFRVLVRARDLYVRRLAACAGGGPVGMVAMPRSQSHGFYRSAGDGDADVRELIRAASRAGPPRAAGVGPRSQSVAIGRIDEDGPCEFGLDDGARAQAMGPRSKSCAVGPTARTARRIEKISQLRSLSHPSPSPSTVLRRRSPTASAISHAPRRPPSTAAAAAHAPRPPPSTAHPTAPSTAAHQPRPSAAHPPHCGGAHHPPRPSPLTHCALRPPLPTHHSLHRRSPTAALRRRSPTPPQPRQNPSARRPEGHLSRCCRGRGSRSRSEKKREEAPSVWPCSVLKSRGYNPIFVGIPRSIPQVLSYMMEEPREEATTQGHDLRQFKYACSGYSMFVDDRDGKSGENDT